MSGSSDEDCDKSHSDSELELEEHVANAGFDSLPVKSRKIYHRNYELFNNWRIAKGAKTCSETVLLSYFMELSKTKQPSTLWSVYSMLKATIKSKRDIRIETYHKLLAFLKRTSEGHKSKKTRVFTAHNIEQFLKEAPDSKFLGTKVALIIGINGACRSTELLQLTVNDIEKHSETLLLVNISTNTKMNRSFVIREEYVDIVEKYKALRPSEINTDRFLLHYQNGKCSSQPMGRNKIGGMPSEIAKFLKLDGPHLYTGHCFRRTSITLLADSGSRADLTILKHHGGCKSNSVAEVYIEDSIENESNISNFIETANMKPEDLWSCSSTSKDIKIEYCPGSPSSEESRTKEAETKTTKITAPKNTVTLNLRSLSPTSSQEPGIKNSDITTTKITTPNKTVTLNLQNCSNLTINF